MDKNEKKQLDARKHLLKAEEKAVSANRKKSSDRIRSVVGFTALGVGWAALNKGILNMVSVAAANIRETGGDVKNIFSQMIAPLANLFPDFRETSYANAFKNFYTNVVKGSKNIVSEIKISDETSIIATVKQKATEANTNGFGDRWRAFKRSNSMDANLIKAVVMIAIPTVILGIISHRKTRNSRHAATGKEFAKYVETHSELVANDVEKKSLIEAEYEKTHVAKKDQSEKKWQKEIKAEREKLDLETTQSFSL